MRITFVSAFLLMSTVIAGATTLAVKDGNGVLQNFDVTVDGSGNYVSRHVICDGTAAATCAAIVGTALKVDGSAVTQPVSAASLPLPTGAATSALQTTINTTLGTLFPSGGSIGNTGFNVTGTLPAFAAVPSFKIDQTTPGTTNLVQVGGTLPAFAALPSFNLSQVNGVTPLMGNGITGTGSQRVTIASDNTAFAVNAAESGTWNITNVSGTVSLPTGASTSANQTAANTPVAPATATATAARAVGGQYNSTMPTFTNGQQGIMQLDQNGALNTGFDGATFAPASVTSATTIFTQDTTGYEGINVQITSAGTTCTITYETSEDNSTWISISGVPATAAGSVALVPTNTSTTAVGLSFAKRFRYFRARVSTYTSGTVTVLYNLTKTPIYANVGYATVGGVGGNATSASGINPVRVGLFAATANQVATNAQTVNFQGTLAGAAVIYPWSIPELTWQHAAVSGGIVNSTTAETLQAAGAAGIRNYVTRLTVSAHGTVTPASEIVVRDGASGTVIFRDKLEAAVQNAVTYNFEPPLRGTAATLVEFATLTAMGASSAVYVNAQGFQGP